MAHSVEDLAEKKSSILAVIINMIIRLDIINEPVYYLDITPIQERNMFMNAWWILFKKEFRLTQSFWAIAALVVIIAEMIGAYFALQFHSGIPSLVLFMLMFFQSFFLLLYLLVSFQMEKSHTPIWIQSPQSGAFLLSVKLAAGFVLMSLSLILNLILWLWVVKLDFQSSLYQGGEYFQSLLAIEGLIKQHWFLSFIVFGQRALFLAALGMLIYFLIDLLKYAIKGWRWIIGLMLFFAGILVIIWFSHTGLFALIFHWGKLDLSDFSALPTLGSVPGPPVTVIFQRFFPVYAGDIVFKFLFATAVFFISAWLLDRKVEV